MLSHRREDEEDGLGEEQEQEQEQDEELEIEGGVARTEGGRVLSARERLTDVPGLDLRDSASVQSLHTFQQYFESATSKAKNLARMCEYRSKTSERALEWHQIMNRRISKEIDRNRPAVHYLRKTVSAYCKEQRKYPTLRSADTSALLVAAQQQSPESKPSKPRLPRSSSGKRVVSSGNVSTRPPSGGHSAYVSSRAHSLYNF